MSPDFDFWEHDTGGEDCGSNQKKGCIHQKVVRPITSRTPEFVCDHPSKKGKICNESECTLKEAI